MQIYCNIQEENQIWFGFKEGNLISGWDCDMADIVDMADIDDIDTKNNRMLLILI